jgi:hypothetical protein
VPLRYGEHPGAWIEPRDGPTGSDAPRDMSREHPGSAGDIEDTLAGLDPGCVGHAGGPLLKQGGNEQ